MKQRHGARVHQERAHRQLQPTDSHNRGSGAPPLYLCPDNSDFIDDGPARAIVVSTASPALDEVVSPWTRRRVLLLNATYEPLAALTVRRAVVLIVCDKAHSVHEDPTGAMVRSAGTAVAIPSVIRLHNYVRVPYRARVPMTRAALMHRDRFRCGYCGGKAETIDHVIPRSRGGEHSWENCVASCADCNHRKADKLLSELGWTLRAPLLPPKGQHWRLLAGIKELDPMWMRYLGEGAA